MVVTSSLARGLVRDAIRRQSARCDAAWTRLRESGVRAPASFRRFREWFDRLDRTFQGRAVLIAKGHVGRRRGFFVSYMPEFDDEDRGWVMRLASLRIVCEPGRIVDFQISRLPLAVCGHALERMFQRGETVEWSAVRDALADGLIFFSAAHRAYVEGGYRQAPLPVADGFLVGELADGVLLCKTFLQAETLNARRAALLRDFRALLQNHFDAFQLAAACGDGEATPYVAACLAAPKHAWLRKPHEPGEDWVGEAWGSRELAMADAT